MSENGRETFLKTNAFFSLGEKKYILKRVTELIHAQCFSYQWNELRDIFRIEGDNIKQNQSLVSRFFWFS